MGSVQHVNVTFTQNRQPGVGGDETCVSIDRPGASVVVPHVEYQGLRSLPARPIGRLGNQRAAVASALGDGAYSDPVEVPDSPLRAHDRVSGRRPILVDDDCCGATVDLQGLSQPHLAHPPEPGEGVLVDVCDLVPHFIVVDHLEPGFAWLLSTQALLPDLEVDVRLIPRRTPYPGGGGVESWRKDSRPRDGHQPSRRRPEEFASPTNEAEHRSRIVVVPLPSLSLEPPQRDLDGLGPAAFDAEQCRHMWESTGMDLIVAGHESSLLHDTGPMHPERPERVLAVRSGLEESGVAIEHMESPETDLSLLELVHDSDYIEAIKRLCATGGGVIDMDTRVSAGSWEAALTAAGGVVALIEEQESRRLPGFALTRPPGHHATRNRAMGFCIFNNLAVGAALLSARGERVVILDWDVHHGNGTQDIVATDPNIVYISIHQDRFYPHEGRLGDIHGGEAPGSVVNVPLPPGTRSYMYRNAFSLVALPVMRQFEPDRVLVSCGFDAHASDPLADLELSSDDYGWMAAQLTSVVDTSRIILALEGGYDLHALTASAAATARGLVGGTEFGDVVADAGMMGLGAVRAAVDTVAPYWDLVSESR